jgi:hypothetical protein
MFDALSFALPAALATAMLAGAMLFFAGGVAPLVFQTLTEADAGRLIRRIFPVYDLVGLGLSALAGLCALLAARPIDAGVLGAVALLFLVARQVLMPQINALRDREVAGDRSASGPFRRLHGLSVWINAAQLLAVLAVTVRLTLAA